jgi:hypothetical protein
VRGAGALVATRNFQSGKYHLPHAAKHLERIGVNLVGALGAAILDVTVVNGKSNVGLVDALKHRLQFGFVVRIFVGHVTPQSKGVASTSGAGGGSLTA